MSEFNPNKLSVEFRDQVSPTHPIIGRRHTLTHSDDTGELFLTVGLNYAYDLINEMRDEVVGELILSDYQLNYCAQVYIGGYDETTVKARDKIFRQELPLALRAIRYGDQQLFQEYPALDHVPIFIQFNSSYSQYQTVENWGDFSDYA